MHRWSALVKLSTFVEVSGYSQKFPNYTEFLYMFLGILVIFGEKKYIEFRKYEENHRIATCARIPLVVL